MSAPLKRLSPKTPLEMTATQSILLSLFILQVALNLLFLAAMFAKARRIDRWEREGIERGKRARLSADDIQKPRRIQKPA